MCEIFCFNSDKPKQINECLECFYNHSENHPHGWGLANMQLDEFVIRKEPIKATKSYLPIAIPSSNWMIITGHGC